MCIRVKTAKIRGVTPGIQIDSKFMQSSAEHGIAAAGAFGVDNEKRSAYLKVLL
jgi:hypothetical protein